MTQQTALLTEQCRKHYDAGSVEDWLSELRQSALQQFTERGLPRRKEEDWRYTDLSVLNQVDFQMARQVTTPDRDLPEYDCHRLVFVNGLYHPELSDLSQLDNEIILLPLSQAAGIFEPFLNDCLPESVMSDRYPLATLNRALLQQGVYFYIPQNTVVDKPVHIIHHTTEDAPACMNHLSHLIWAAPNSEATIIEEYTGTGDKQWTNMVHQWFLKPAARLHYYKLQNDNATNIHTDTTLIRQERDSSFSSTNCSLGAALSRDDWRVQLNEQNSECRLNGLYMPRGRQLIDHHLQVEHNAGHTQSDVYYKGLAAERGKAVYNGRVIVPHDCQKVQANQYNPNVLLSNKAEINAKPELLINADDVKCTHGSTVGYLDQQALNYLRCRGLSYDNALGMLLYAFVRDAVTTIGNDHFQRDVHQAMVENLPFAPPRIGANDDGTG